MVGEGAAGEFGGVVGPRRAAERGVCRRRAFPPPATAQAAQYACQGLVGPDQREQPNEGTGAAGGRRTRSLDSAF